MTSDLAHQTGDVPVYPVDGIYLDESEKAHIEGLSELDREVFLAERHGQLDRIRQNDRLRKLVDGRETHPSHTKPGRVDPLPELKTTTRPTTPSNTVKAKNVSVRPDAQSRWETRLWVIETKLNTVTG